MSAEQVVYAWAERGLTRGPGSFRAVAATPGWAYGEANLGRLCTRPVPADRSLDVVAEKQRVVELLVVDGVPMVSVKVPGGEDGHGRRGSWVCTVFADPIEPLTLARALQLGESPGVVTAWSPDQPARPDLPPVPPTHETAPEIGPELIEPLSLLLHFALHPMPLTVVRSFVPGRQRAFAAAAKLLPASFTASTTLSTQDYQPNTNPATICFSDPASVMLGQPSNVRRRVLDGGDGADLAELDPVAVEVARAVVDRHVPLPVSDPTAEALRAWLATPAPSPVPQPLSVAASRSSHAESAARDSVEDWLNGVSAAVPSASERSAVPGQHVWLPDDNLGADASTAPWLKMLSRTDATAAELATLAAAGRRHPFEVAAGVVRLRVATGRGPTGLLDAAIDGYLTMPDTVALLRADAMRLSELKPRAEERRGSSSRTWLRELLEQVSALSPAEIQDLVNGEDNARRRFGTLRVLVPTPLLLGILALSLTLVVLLGLLVVGG